MLKSHRFNRFRPKSENSPKEGVYTRISAIAALVLGVASLYLAVKYGESAQQIEDMDSLLRRQDSLITILATQSKKQDEQLGVLTGLSGKQDLQIGKLSALDSSTLGLNREVQEQFNYYKKATAPNVRIEKITYDEAPVKSDTLIQTIHLKNFGGRTAENIEGESYLLKIQGGRAIKLAEKLDGVKKENEIAIAPGGNGSLLIGFLRSDKVIRNCYQVVKITYIDPLTQKPITKVNYFRNDPFWGPFTGIKENERTVLKRGVDSLF